MSGPRATIERRGETQKRENLVLRFRPEQADYAKAAAFAKNHNPVSNYFDADNLARFIHGMEGVYTGPATSDPAKVAAVFEQAVKNVGADLAALPTDWSNLRTQPEALAATLGQLEAAYAQVQNLVGFYSFVSQVHGRRSMSFVEALYPSLPELQQTNQQLVHQNGAFAQAMLPLGLEGWQQLVEQHPPLAAYTPFLKAQWRENMSPETLAKTDREQVSLGQAAFWRAGDDALPQEERSEALAEAMSRMAIYKHSIALAKGHADSMGAFYDYYQAPPGAIDAIDVYAKKLHNQILRHSIPLKMEMADDVPAPYSWQEACDIVATAYERIDQRLGARVRDAVAKGYVQATQNMPQPATMPAAPLHAETAAQPIVKTSFNGHAAEVIMLGHEMAHFLSASLAGERHGAMTVVRDMLAEEIFSHTAELFVEQTMMVRARTQTERHAILNGRLEQRGVTPMSMSMGEFERQLINHPTIAEGKTLSYAEMDDLYQAAFKKYGGQAPGTLNNYPGMLQFLNPAPHYSLVYPIATELAPVLHAAIAADPKRLGPVFYGMLADGSIVTIGTLWQGITGLPPEAMSETLAKGSFEFLHLGNPTMREATAQELEASRRHGLTATTRDVRLKGLLAMPKGEDGFLAFSGLERSAANSVLSQDPAGDWVQMFGELSPERMRQTLTRGLPKPLFAGITVGGAADPAFHDAILDEKEKNFPALYDSEEHRHQQRERDRANLRQYTINVILNALGLRPTLAPLVGLLLLFLSVLGPRPLFVRTLVVASVASAAVGGALCALGRAQAVVAADDGPCLRPCPRLWRLGRSGCAA